MRALKGRFLVGIIWGKTARLTRKNRRINVAGGGDGGGGGREVKYARVNKIIHG